MFDSKTTVKHYFLKLNMTEHINHPNIQGFEMQGEKHIPAEKQCMGLLIH